MFCTQCGTNNTTDARFCQKCGHAMPQQQDQLADAPLSANAPKGSGVITVQPEHRRSGVVALVLRSMILGGVFSPITNDDYWQGLVTQAVSGAVVALILYGLEKFLMRLLRKQMSVRPVVVAGYRGALLLFTLSLAKFGDVPMALGSAMAGAFVAAGLCGIELGTTKLFGKYWGRGA